MARRSLVTGAGGFVGANLVRRLIEAGDEVVAAVRPGGDRWRLEGVDAEIAELDLADPENVGAVVAAARPERVFHLAAHGAYSWQRSVRPILEVTVLGTAALLEAARAAGTEVVVHAGSSSEYGFKAGPPAEDEALEPNSVYAIGKAAATYLCSLERRAGGMRATTLRLYSVYGPWEEPGRLVPRLLTHALAGTLPPLADPGIARDFIHVNDACDALLAAAAAEDPADVYNVASGRQTTLAELVAALRAVLPGVPEPRWGDYGRRDWDTEVWYGDPRRIAADLGWRAGIDLESGLRRTLAWFEREAPRQRYAEES